MESYSFTFRMHISDRDKSSLCARSRHANSVWSHVTHEPRPKECSGMRHKRKRRAARSDERIVVRLAQQGRIGHGKHRLFVESVRGAVVLYSHDRDARQLRNRRKECSGALVVVSRPEHRQPALRVNSRLGVHGEHTVKHRIERLQKPRLQRLSAVRTGHAEPPGRRLDGRYLRRAFTVCVIRELIVREVLKGPEWIGERRGHGNYSIACVQVHAFGMHESSYRP